MMYSQIFLLGLLLFSYWILKYSLKFDRIFIYFLLLLITPWFWTLLVGEPPLLHLLNVKGQGSIIFNNLEIVLSYRNLFFESNPVLFYIVGNHGYFLLSFLPLIISGIWISLNSTNLFAKKIVLIFPIFIFISAFLVHLIGLLSVYILLPVLTYFATIGFTKFVTLLKKDSNKIIRVFIIINIILIFYESVRLLRVIQVQFGILNQ